tara:strand:- start:197 stop:391 length:195 start_codon:yes stop_codon:yes gene_type:complete
MFKFIKSLFISPPGDKIRKARDRKYEEAVQLQRDGNLRGYSKVMKEIEDLEAKYVEAVNDDRSK